MDTVTVIPSVTASLLPFDFDTGHTQLVSTLRVGINTTFELRPKEYLCCYHSSFDACARDCQQSDLSVSGMWNFEQGRNNVLLGDFCILK